MANSYKTIVLPTRPQVDTIVAIFILRHFGKAEFPGIEDATYVSLSTLPDGATEESMAEEGKLLIDIGKGKFDHHNKEVQTTATNLVAEYLGQKNNPALSKLIKFIERDDFFGKGILSTDPLDRAFGLPGLTSCLNKKYKDNPVKVIESILPLIDAFYFEEEKREFEMPQELEEKLANGKAKTFTAIQRGKKLKCIFIESDNTSMAGFLRSMKGGSFDVTAMKLSSGHVNILTGKKRPDLQSLAVLVRIQETEAQGTSVGEDPEYLAKTGTISEVPEWYFDPATNSLLNGGPNPQNINPTKIATFEFQKIIELGLSESIWKPLK
jgi:hypothetical protein